MVTIWPYKVYGNPINPPILFLHGFLGEGTDWLRVAEGMSTRHFCILPDLPGHGANVFHLHNEETKPSLSFDIINASLCAFLDSLAIQQTHLVGYSMGGRAALYFAIHHPERILSLTLESASPGITNPEERRARAGEDDRRAAMILTEGVEPFIDHWYTLPLFRSLENYPDIRAQLIRRRKMNDPYSAAKVIRDLSPGRQPSVWDQLPRLRTPVLLITGALDEKYLAIGKKVNAQIPKSRWKIIPSSGHTPHLEQPNIFSALLWEFLDWVGTIPEV